MNIVMTNKIFVTLFFCILVISAKAEVFLETDSIDLGETMYADSVTAIFHFENRNRMPMFIDKVDASCGCTQVEYPKMMIKPNKSFEISITYDAMQLGHYAKWVDVYFDTEKEPVRLTIFGIIRSPRQAFVGRRRFTQEYQKQQEELERQQQLQKAKEEEEKAAAAAALLDQKKSKKDKKRKKSKNKQKQD